MKGMRMQTANQVLTAIRKLGVKRLPLTRVYRCLYHESLFLLAYQNLTANDGALTPGPDADTIDGMSYARIHTIIAALRAERFRVRPARRVMIPKRNGGTRPLGMPNFTEKLVQEVLRLILDAYYEPRFRPSSHGFRAERGCHTALVTINHTFRGTAWFIEGDIQGAFDQIDHTVLLAILARDIHDGRLLELLRRHLNAGIMEAWRYQKTYSGVPQGGVLSPLLSNIYFHELDVYVEEELIPRWWKGKRRRNNPAYKTMEMAINRARRTGDRETERRLLRERRHIPASDRYDPTFRRLRYIRYADDFLLGFCGPRHEAQAIVDDLRRFLAEHLKLTLHPEKTRITHGMTEYAQFLGYAVSIYSANDKLTRRSGTGPKIRAVNSKVRLGIPSGRIQQYVRAYQTKGTITSVRYLIDDSIASIIQIFQARFRGIANYYQYAVDRHELRTLKYVMEIALVKTIAHKLRIKATEVYRRYRARTVVDGEEYRTLQYTVVTNNATRHYQWGGIPLRVKDATTGKGIVDERRYYEQFHHYERRTGILARLAAHQCELCGSQTDCEVHHIRKLADLKQRWAGRRAKPPWVVKMIALRRKTLVVCRTCHRAIHAGTSRGTIE